MLIDVGLPSLGLGLGLNRSRHLLAIRHTGAFQDVFSLLGLVEEESIGIVTNLDAEEEVEGTEILDRKGVA